MTNGVTGTPLLTLTHMDTGVKFYHLSDERAFFEWLTRIPCVQNCEGDGNRGLVVRLKRRRGKDDLWQLLALCHRYGVDMKQLAKFETAKNRVWFAIHGNTGTAPCSENHPRGSKRRVG